MTTSVFAPYQQQNYPHRFAGTLHLDSIAGGVPLDPKVLEGHLARKIDTSDDLIRDQITKMVAESGVTYEEAVEEAAKMKGLTGFAKDEHGLYVGGYQLKAALKEAACIAASEKRIPQKWGGASEKGKALRSWFPEHVFVCEHRLPLGVKEPSEVKQSFIHKMGSRGPVSAIQYTEVVLDADVEFTVETDYGFKPEEWAAIWTTCEHMGLGAARPMGYGRFSVTKWEEAPMKSKRR